MTYIVSRSTSTNAPITITDGSVNVVDTSLSLIGRNYPNYGQALANNFVHMLENFSSSFPPTNPIQGQLWYNSSNGKLSIFDGLQWVTLNYLYASTSNSLSANPQVGDVWSEAVVGSSSYTIKIYDGTNWQNPTNFYASLTGTAITSLAVASAVTGAAQLPIVDQGIVYNITKDDFLADSVTPNLVKTGMIMMWPMDTIPSGWVKCDGSTFPRTGSYANLFSILGTRYGTTTPTNFQVPNLTGPTVTTPNGPGSTVTLNYIIKI